MLPCSFRWTQSNWLTADMKYDRSYVSWICSWICFAGFFFVFWLVSWFICFNNVKVLRLLKSSFTIKVYLNTLEGEN